ncbi:MAG: cytochrome-c oxidase, cbb3-type subunit III [Gammaproteobacteria bacterium]|nr:cytochrome-c oxidase, cbb3-type subunit III [Gammaproteobacteria bacterium]
MSSEKSKPTVQTTGHAWDGDLQEFNNPLPTWWLWTFYATVVFAIIYWVLYPAWPVGGSYTKGMMNDITYTTADGKTKTTHWNTRALLLKEMQIAREEQAEYLKDINALSFEQIRSKPEKSAFANSMAKVLFADNCAACHQSGGDGVMGRYPNLLDDAWLWGGSFDKIQETIANGRTGSMPGFKASLSTKQISDVSDYVLSLSGNEADAAAVKRGQAIFSGQGGCAACHGADAKGQDFMGSANLTDKIWTIADVSGAETAAAKKEAVMNVVKNGKTRVMPAWKGRLSATEIKILTYYVHQLGGGK